MKSWLLLLMYVSKERTLRVDIKWDMPVSDLLNSFIVSCVVRLWAFVALAVIDEPIIDVNATSLSDDINLVSVKLAMADCTDV
jgi:hypothetical protein